jgi:hypothetical protein
MWGLYEVQVVARRSVQQDPDTFLLEQDNWDDFGYRTQFLLCYRDARNFLHDIGMVKIALFGLTPPFQSGVRPGPVVVSLPGAHRCTTCDGIVG